jgi:Tfp pilus assembly PilM family ATPase
MSNRKQTDIAIFNLDSVSFVRLVPGKTRPHVEKLRQWSLPHGTFEIGAVTPSLRNAEAITEVASRMKVEAGRLERVTVLLPDSWFRMNLIDVPKLPRKAKEANEVVRWSLKRSTPFNPNELRIQWMPISSRGQEPARILVISALEKSIAMIEAAFSSAGVAVGAIEAAGLNVWNAILTRDTPTDGRVLVYLRDHDFTTCVFKGTEPLFIRSRSLGGERRVEQEIRLSASFLRPMLETNPVSKCYVAGNGQVTSHVVDVLTREFGADVEVLDLPAFADTSAVDASHSEAELIACRGVLTT